MKAALCHGAKAVKRTSAENIGTQSHLSAPSVTNMSIERAAWVTRALHVRVNSAISATKVQNARHLSAIVVARKSAVIAVLCIAVTLVTKEFATIAVERALAALRFVHLAGIQARADGVSHMCVPMRTRNHSIVTAAAICFVLHVRHWHSANARTAINGRPVLTAVMRAWSIINLPPWP